MLTWEVTIKEKIDHMRVNVCMCVHMLNNLILSLLDSIYTIRLESGVAFQCVILVKLSTPWTLKDDNE